MHMRLVIPAVMLTLSLSLGLASPAGATTPAQGTGTFTDLTATTTSARTADGNMFITQAVTGLFTGAVAGTFAQTISLTIHPDGTLNFHGTETCTCTVDGTTGPYMDAFRGTGAADGTFQGSFVVSGTGALAGLHGAGSFTGSGNTGTYAIGLHSHP